MDWVDNSNGKLISSHHWDFSLICKLIPTKTIQSLNSLSNPQVRARPMIIYRMAKSKAKWWNFELLAESDILVRSLVAEETQRLETVGFGKLKIPVSMCNHSLSVHCSNHFIFAGTFWSWITGWQAKSYLVFKDFKGNRFKRKRKVFYFSYIKYWCFWCSEESCEKARTVISRWWRWWRFSGVHLYSSRVKNVLISDDITVVHQCSRTQLFSFKHDHTSLPSNNNKKEKWLQNKNTIKEGNIQ